MLKKKYKTSSKKHKNSIKKPLYFFLLFVIVLGSLKVGFGADNSPYRNIYVAGYTYSYYHNQEGYDDYIVQYRGGRPIQNFNLEEGKNNIITEASGGSWYDFNLADDIRVEENGKTITLPKNTDYQIPAFDAIVSPKSELPTEVYTKYYTDGDLTYAYNGGTDSFYLQTNDQNWHKINIKNTELSRYIFSNKEINQPQQINTKETPSQSTPQDTSTDPQNPGSSKDDDTCLDNVETYNLINQYKSNVISDDYKKQIENELLKRKIELEKSKNNQNKVKELKSIEEALKTDTSSDTNTENTPQTLEQQLAGIGDGKSGTVTINGESVNVIKNGNSYFIYKTNNAGQKIIGNPIDTTTGVIQTQINAQTVMPLIDAYNKGKTDPNIINPDLSDDSLTLLQKFALNIVNNKKVDPTQIKNGGTDLQYYIANLNGNPNQQVAIDAYVAQTSKMKSENLNLILKNSQTSSQLANAILNQQITQLTNPQTAGETEGRINNLQQQLSQANNDKEKQEIQKQIKALQDQLPENRMATICKGVSDKCLTVMINGNEASKNLAINLIEKQVITISDTQLNNIMLNLNEEQRDAMMKAATGSTCSGLSSIWCSIIGNKNQQERFLSSISQTNQQTRQNSLSMPKDSKGIKIGKDKTVCEREKTYSACSAAIKNACGEKNTKCINNALSEFQKQAVMTETKDEYNEKLIDNLLKNPNFAILDTDDKALLSSACKDGYSDSQQSCQDAINTLSICEDPNSFECQMIHKGIKQTSDQQIVDTNLGFDIISLLKNPDESAMKAAKLFGLDIKLGKLGWLGENIESKICSKHIDGYLDKQLSNNAGGVTQYGCDKYDLEKYPSNKCLEVLGDIRSHRTQITPNNKTMIYYSYYIKAPIKGNIKYIIALLYEDNGRIVKIPLTQNFTTLNAGTTTRKEGVENINITKNSKSFTISLLALYAGRTEDEKHNTNEIYVKINSPVYLATPESLTGSFKESGNTQGNEEAQNNKNIEFTVDDALKMTNIIES